MKTSLAAAAAILPAMAIFAAPSTHAQDDPAVVEAAAAPVQTVAPADVLKMLDDHRADIALVDTQPADGFADAHIRGAINYPWVMRIKQFPIVLPRNKTLIFYGSCPNDTADIVRQLAEFGYFNVKIMDGGLERWIALHYPTAGTTAKAPAPELSQVTKSDQTTAR